MVEGEEKGRESYTDGVPKENGGEPTEKMRKQVSSYTIVLMNLIHSEKTREEVVGMITSSNDPFISIPQAAVAINDMAVNLMGNQGRTAPSFGVQLGSAPYLVNDLVELGYATKTFEKLSEEDFGGIMEDSIQIVVERGLADGSIDPIQLQLDTEGLMTDEQKQAGNQLAEKEGVGAEPNPNAMVEQYADKKVAKNEQRNVQKVAKQQVKQRALEGPPQGQPPEQGGQV